MSSFILDVVLDNYFLHAYWPYAVATIWSLMIINCKFIALICMAVNFFHLSSYHHIQNSWLLIPIHQNEMLHGCHFVVVVSACWRLRCGAQFATSSCLHENKNRMISMNHNKRWMYIQLRRRFLDRRFLDRRFSLFSSKGKMQ